MVCVLPIYRGGSVLYQIPVSTQGRLTIHQGRSSSYEAQNQPAVPADQGGKLPIYRNGVQLYLIPFLCPSPDTTRSSGSSGGVSGTTALEGGVSGTGSAFGRLF